MKRIISLALVLVMAMVALTACGVELKAPEGVYSTESGTYKVEFSGYDAKANVGNLTITRTLMDLEDVIKGTFTVVANGDSEDTFIIDFTPEGGEVIESLMVYGSVDNVIAQYKDVGDIGGANSSYYFGLPE